MTFVPTLAASPISRRSFALGLGLFTAGCAKAAADDCSNVPAKVLFICQAGTVKSPVARELFKRRAAERGLKIVVNARGIVPEEHMSPKLLAAAKADGIDPKTEPVQALTIDDMRAADVVIYFDRPPSISVVPDALDWTDVPSMNDDYTGTRAMILARSESVMDQLAARSCKGST